MMRCWMISLLMALFADASVSYASSCQAMLMNHVEDELVFTQDLLSSPLSNEVLVKDLTDGDGKLWLFRYIKGEYDPKFNAQYPNHVSYYDVNPWAVAERGNFRPFGGATGPDVVLVSLQDFSEDGLTRRRAKTEIIAYVPRNSEGRLLIQETDEMAKLGLGEVRVDIVAENVVYILSLENFRKLFHKRTKSFTHSELRHWLEPYVRGG